MNNFGNRPVNVLGTVRKVFICNFLLMIFSAMATESTGQNVQLNWANNGQIFPYGISIGPDNNLVTTGFFSGKQDFDATKDTFFLSSNRTHSYVTKISPSGKVIWGKSFGNSLGGTSATKVVVDSNKNVLITGIFRGKTDFDPGPDTFFMESGGNLSSIIFILKLDSLGNFLWAKKLEGVGSGYTENICNGPKGSFIIQGSFFGKIDFDPGVDTFYASSLKPNGRDVYILKISSSGQFLWLRTFGSQARNHQDFASMGSDWKGNIYFCGTFTDSLDADPDTGSHWIKATKYNQVYKNHKNTLYDAYLIKLDTNGQLIWAKTFGSRYHDYAGSIAVDSTGNCYVAGKYWIKVDFDPGSDTFYLTGHPNHLTNYVAKYSPNGKFIWAQSLHRDSLSYVDCRSLSVRGSELYCFGAFSGKVDLDPGQDSIVYDVGLSIESFMYSQDTSGKLRWTKHFETNAINKVVMASAIKAKDELYVGGIFFDKIDIDPGPDSLIFKTAKGEYIGGFMCKLANCKPKISKIPKTVCDSFNWKNEVTFYSSGQYRVDTLINATRTGCDSVIELDLKVNPSYHHHKSVTICDSFKWLNGKTYFESDSFKIYKTKRVNGCDSVITLNLTIL